ncbi:hypothetical protein HanXRQr2_Chr07g0296941 [Helianthus annuus]|uniref:Uncharacterized protein n=1 Tax=Helianthus annuus TaxID=4232 RepID=A0A9K3ILT0_HELAN|nr:hypothetical protein HanXRQr2_Chr07g0296941 [Helianthus annuus]KAJ0904880.1 hypothetical protein HanPSC8_Chr07g0287451 [Helianthus annuus]
MLHAGGKYDFLRHINKTSDLRMCGFFSSEGFSSESKEVKLASLLELDKVKLRI